MMTLRFERDGRHAAASSPIAEHDLCPRRRGGNVAQRGDQFVFGHGSFTRERAREASGSASPRRLDPGC